MCASCVVHGSFEISRGHSRRSRRASAPPTATRARLPHTKVKELARRALRSDFSDFFRRRVQPVSSNLCSSIIGQYEPCILESGRSRDSATCNVIPGPRASLVQVAGRGWTVAAVRRARNSSSRPELVARGTRVSFWSASSRRATEEPFVDARAVDREGTTCSERGFARDTFEIVGEGSSRGRRERWRR